MTATGSPSVPCSLGIMAEGPSGGEPRMGEDELVAVIRKVLSGESPLFQTEELKPRDRAFETVGTQLRRAAGIDRTRFREQTGFDLDELLGHHLTGLVANGLLYDDGTSVRLTRRGLCVADGVIEELMKANGERPA